MSETAAPALPLFYTKVVGVNPNLHGAVRLNRAAGYGFAAGAASIPVGLGEFGLVARHYPIVFAAGAVPAPVALVGINEVGNLYVDGAGAWRVDAYVPAYVRAYPFIFVEDPARSTTYVGMDEGAACLGQETGERLFEDGKPTTTSTTAASGLSLAFLRARARAASALTKDDADSSAPQEFHGGVLGQPWQRGCACEVRLIGKSRRGALASLFFFAIFLALTDSSSPSSRRQAANFFLFLLSPRGPLLSLLSLSLSQRRALSFGRHLTKKLKQTEKNRESATARLAGFPLPPPPPPPPPPP